MKRLIPFVLLGLVFSCKKQDTEIIYGYEYFPSDSGKYVIYDVIDIQHDDLVGVHDTDYYQIMEVVGEEDIDLEDETFNKFYRYKRESDTLNWQLKDVWVLKKTNRSVELVEENDRVIKMAFSISYDQYWDCNALNNESAEQCYYRNIYEPMTVGGIYHDSTVVVEREDFTSFIERKRSFDVYSRNIGRIETYFKDLEINAGDTMDVHKGTEMYFTAIEWGG